MVTAGGSHVTNLFVQEDRVIIPIKAETITHFPLVLACETAETLYKATMEGMPGRGMHKLLAALEGRRLNVALFIDNSDMGAFSNVDFGYVQHEFR